MVYRISWIAGVAGIGFALARAERLLRASTSGVPWEALMVAAVILGATLTWAALAYRFGSRWIAALNVVAMSITLIRIAVPGTTWLIFPTGSSFPALSAQMAITRDLIRTGIAPVAPVAGIIAILAAVFWGMGALLTWGLMTGRPYVAVLTPMVVYLEFAVMDRRPSGVWTTIFMIVLGFALLSVALDRRRDGTGVLVSPVTRLALVRSLPSIGVVVLVVAMAIAAGASAAMATLVPHNGYLAWRSTSGLSGDYYGSVAYNPFVGIRQGLLSQTNVPVFVAKVTGDIPGNQIYWRLVTLDTYDGNQWHIAEDPKVVDADTATRFERADLAFAGPSASVSADVTILALQMDWLPAPYAPVSLSADNDAVQHGVRVRVDDGSLRFDALTYRGMTYTVDAQVPVPDLDVLARRDDGTPSPVFRDAIVGGDFTLDTTAPAITRRTLPDAAHFLDLPSDLDSGIAALARDETRGLQTDFERALALENFFRTPGAFRYSTSIVPGHGATDLAAWLLDPQSDNYRTGYCEQFATSMAVMARTLGIPSRVVLGFAPGTDYEDGVVVRDRNAHAWVEVWLPTQGWVRFDPTPRGDNSSTSAGIPFSLETYLASAPPITAPPDGEDPGTSTPSTRPEIDPANPGGAATGSRGAARIPGWSGWLAVALVAGIGILPAVKGVRRRRRIRALESGDVGAGWSEIVDRLADLGDRPSVASTPAEIAATVDRAMDDLADVYAEAVYGAGAPLSGKRLAAAVRSFRDTEAVLRAGYSPGRRIVARYRLISLWPGRRVVAAA